MKSLILAASALLLTTGVVFAATPTPPPMDQGQPGAQNQSAVPTQTTDMQQQVKNRLAKEGFTDIQIMPESFLVRAKDHQGNAVMMVMNPDSFTEVTTIDQKQRDAASNKMDSGQNGAGDDNGPPKHIGDSGSAKTDAGQSK